MSSRIKQFNIYSQSLYFTISFNVSCHTICPLFLFEETVIYLILKKRSYLEILKVSGKFEILYKNLVFRGVHFLSKISKSRAEFLVKFSCINNFYFGTNYENIQYKRFGSQMYNGNKIILFPVCLWFSTYLFD